MEAVILRLGRISALIPAALGKQFEEDCTVRQREEVRPSAENNWTSSIVIHERRMFFYQQDPGTQQEAFCFMQGYTQRIKDGLKAQGVNARIEIRVQHGLPYPDFSRLDLAGFRQFQIPAAHKIFAYDTGLIIASTGSGKTFLAKQIFKAYPNSKVVFACPFAAVVKETYAALRAEGMPVGIAGAGKNRKADHMVVCSDSLHHCDPDTNLIIVDECHKAVSPDRAKKYNLFNRAKIFGFTASPEGRSDGTDGLLEAIFGQPLLEITYQESVAAGNVVPIKVRMIQSCVGPNGDLVEDKQRFDSLCIHMNDARNRLIAKVAMEALQEPDAQVLIMVATTEHAYRIQNHARDFMVISGEPTQKRVEELVKCKAYDPTWQKICTEKIKDKAALDFSAGRLRAAIATSVWSTGVDFKDLTHLVRADGLASEHANIQIPGRLSRKGADGQKGEGILIDFYDSFCRRVESRTKRRIISYRKNGWEIGS